MFTFQTEAQRFQFCAAAPLCARFCRHFLCCNHSVEVSFRFQNAPHKYLHRKFMRYSLCSNHWGHHYSNLRHKINPVPNTTWKVSFKSPMPCVKVRRTLWQHDKAEKMSYWYCTKCERSIDDFETTILRKKLIHNGAKEFLCNTNIVLTTEKKDDIARLSHLRWLTHCTICFLFLLRCLKTYHNRLLRTISLQRIHLYISAPLWLPVKAPWLRLNAQSFSIDPFPKL